MMSIIKKSVKILLVSVLLLQLFGCGKSNYDKFKDALTSAKITDIISMYNGVSDEKAKELDADFQKATNDLITEYSAIGSAEDFEKSNLYTSLLKSYKNEDGSVNSADAIGGYAIPDESADSKFANDDNKSVLKKWMILFSEMFIFDAAAHKETSGDLQSAYNGYLSAIVMQNNSVSLDLEIQSKLIDIANEKIVELEPKIIAPEGLVIDYNYTTKTSGRWDIASYRISFSLTNNTGKAIDLVYASGLAYDSDGHVINEGYSDKEFFAAYLGDVAINDGESFIIEGDLYSETPISKVKLVITDVGYYGGAEWENDYQFYDAYLSFWQMMTVK